MRVLVGHNYYQQAGGEDSVFRAHLKLLKDFGHTPIPYERHNHDIKQGALSRLAQLTSLRFSTTSYDQVRELIDRERPDIAHFHNTFFMMTPSVFYACRDAKVPVVVSLHNFRLMCINGLFFRDHAPCEDCLNDKWAGVKHRCYRNSHLLSALLTDMLAYHRRKHTWTKVLDRIIVATDFTKEKHQRAGIPADKIAVLPHYCPDPGRISKDEAQESYFLYAGRLSDEKGIELLVKAWAGVKSMPLYIVGDGPLREKIETMVKEKNLTHVRLLGFVERKQYISLLSQACCVVVPSVCYDNFPQVVVEAYAHGVGVLTSDIGSFREFVQDGKTGLLFKTGDEADLLRQLNVLIGDRAHCRKMGVSARTVYEEKYAPKPFHEGLMRIYAQVKRQA